MGLEKLFETSDFEKVLFLQARIKNLLTMVKSVLTDNKRLEAENLKLKTDFNNAVDEKMKKYLRSDNNKLRRERRKEDAYKDIRQNLQSKRKQVNLLREEKEELLKTNAENAKTIIEQEYQLKLMHQKIKRLETKLNQ